MSWMDNIYIVTVKCYASKTYLLCVKCFLKCVSVNMRNIRYNELYESFNSRISLAREVSYWSGPNPTWRIYGHLCHSQQQDDISAFTSAASLVPPCCRVKEVNLTDTLGSTGAGMVSVATLYDLLLARVRAHSVDTVEARAARLTKAVALIYICS